MQAFQRGTDMMGCFGISAEQGRAFYDQEGPQAFAAVQHTMTHGVEQVLRARNLIRTRLCGKQATKQGFGLCRVIAQLRFEIRHLSVHAALFGMARGVRQPFRDS
jgi:hypothetical protein